MKQDKRFHEVDARSRTPSVQSAEEMEMRTRAVVAALRVALDKVYSEDGEQRVRRLARDYRDWSGEAVPGPQPPNKDHK